MQTILVKIPAEKLSPELEALIEKLGTFTGEHRGEGLAEITLKAETFRNAFAETCAFLRSVAQIDETAIHVGSTRKSNGYVLNLADEIEANEARLLKEKKTNGDRPEGWGYSLLNAIDRYLPDSIEAMLTGKYWFQFGTFIGEGIWSVDKNQIRAILKQQAEDRMLHFCPSFDMGKTEGIIDRLPDTIDARENPNWSVYFVKEVDGSRVHERPGGVVHKLTGRSGKRANETDQAEKTEAVRNIPMVSFGDIGGIDHIISRVREVIELPLKNPGLFKHMGIKPHKGIMLYGPPGCGKTMIAKAIAHEVKAHFISVKGPELLNKYYGQSEENLRNLFNEARDLEPAIIFFDEIDAIAQKRSGSDNLRMDARFVNQLLTLMDGIEDFGRVCVIGATNRVELIDEALLRPGRFDYRLEVKKPDAAGCRKIFKITTKGMPLADDVDADGFSGKLTGLTGADIAYIAREAAYICLRRNMDLKNGFDPEKAEATVYAHFRIEARDFDEALKSLAQPEG